MKKNPGSVKCPECGTWNQEPSDDTMYECYKCGYVFLSTVRREMTK
jgi:DNA-directed RNA polymerase subunit RPC12/RpoP